MRFQNIQTTSLIGPVEEKSGNCGHDRLQNAQIQGENPFGSRLQQAMGAAVLVIAGVFALNDRCNQPVNGMGALDSARTVQSADVIDDIIDIIEDIINPPMPPEP